MKLLALLVVLFLPALTRADPLPPEQWKNLIRSYDKGVREKDAGAQKAARDGFKTIQEVRRESDGVVVRVSPRRFPGSANPSRDETLFAAQLKELAERELARPGPDPRLKAREILARPEFVDAAKGKNRKSALEQWLEDTFKQIGKFLDRIFGRLPKGNADENANALLGFAQTVRLLLYFLGAVGVLVLAYQGIKLARESGWLKFKKKKKSESAEDSDLLALSVEDPLREARDAEEAGEWRQAVRLIYIATLRQLRDQGYLVLEANNTNGEYQRQLGRRSSELARLLLPATLRFDRIWYGKRTASAEDAQAMRSCLLALTRGTGL